MWCDVRQTKPWQEIRRRFGQTWTEPLLEDWCRIPWHYGDTGIMMSPADMPRPWDKMLQLEQPHPPPQKQFKWFQENFSNHWTLKYPARVLVPGVEGEGAPLTSGAGDKLWHPDNIGTWSLTLADTSPRTPRRGLVISIHADCRLPLSETFSCYETITKPGVWGMLHKTFICLSF